MLGQEKCYEFLDRNTGLWISNVWSALSANKRNLGIADFTKSLIAAGKSVVHDVGQVMLTTTATIEKGSWYDTGRRSLIAMATFWFKIEAVSHNSLPLLTVWPQFSAFFAGLPVHDQVRHFMGDRLVQKVVEILTKKLLIDAKTGSTIVVNPGLAGTSAT